MEEKGADISRLLGLEGLYSLGSGYLHTRSTLEEMLEGDPQNRTYLRMPGNVTAEKFAPSKQKVGTYVPGVFGQHPTLNRQMVNLPSCLGISLRCGDDTFDWERSDLIDPVRRLDLRHAVLSRQCVWRLSTGATIALSFERFVSAAQPQLLLQRIRFFSDREVEVVIRGGIDTDVRTSGFDHFENVSLGVADGMLHSEVITDTGTGVSCATMFSGDGEFLPEARVTDRTLDFEFSLRLSVGRESFLQKRSSYSTSRDTTGRKPAKMVLQHAKSLTWEELMQEHVAKWEERWEQSDVQIQGNPEDQLAMRVSIYHLLRCHVPEDPRVTIDAKGYAGDAYFGRFFWDTEMYLLPFFLYTNPGKARTLVDFRRLSLEGARQNAREYGYPGARYPWESDELGRENCPNWQYRDHEVHVTADVVYGWAHYAAAVPEENYLSTIAEALVETARYWMARMDTREGDAHPSLLGVMGPNEYIPITSNNAYTNRLVKFVLHLASGELGATGGASRREREIFLRAADLLPIPRAKNNACLILENEFFESLAPPAFATLWKDRTKGYYGQAPQERIYRSQNLKQADVLMLMMLFPEEFSEDEVRTAWEFYLPRTTHDSSLSAGAHAIIACRLGKIEDALGFWDLSSRLDLNGGAAHGIHIASCGVNWQIAVFGFAGVSTALSARDLHLRPVLPDRWTTLSFPLRWKGTPLRVELSKSKTCVKNLGSAAIDVVVHDTKKTVQPGTAEIFESK